MSNAVTCHHCGFLFDRRDKRGLVYRAGSQEMRSCPICTLSWNGSTEAWCVKNDCQGLFGEGVRLSKEAAEELLPTDYFKGAGCYVVRVLVVEKSRLDPKP